MVMMNAIAVSRNIIDGDNDGNDNIDGENDNDNNIKKVIIMTIMK